LTGSFQREPRRSCELTPSAMADPSHALTVQLLEWLGHQPRTYPEVLDAWRTSCPRLSIWEDACIDGLISYDPDGSRIVSVSPKGRALLLERQALSGP
jgi:hypothetical protein